MFPQVKAHEVRALAASLAFKGGGALDEIMASCFWRSHSTFTKFYLKDLCWHNGDVMKIGCSSTCCKFLISTVIVIMSCLIILVFLLFSKTLFDLWSYIWLFMCFRCGLMIVYSCNYVHPLGGWHIIFAFSAVRRPPSHLVSRHFRQQFLSYLYPIWHAGLLG